MADFGGDGIRLRGISGKRLEEKQKKSFDDYLKELNDPLLLEKLTEKEKKAKGGLIKGMAKLCARGKSAAKRKFKVYPSAYANMYASAVCSGKIVPGGRKKKMGGGSISQDRKMVSNYKQGGIAKGCGAVMENKRKVTKKY